MPCGRGQFLKSQRGGAATELRNWPSWSTVVGKRYGTRRPGTEGFHNPSRLRLGLWLRSSQSQQPRQRQCLQCGTPLLSTVEKRPH